MSKSISLPKCNLYLHGTKNDTNGNRVVILSYPSSSRNFTIQANGGQLSKTASILRGYKNVSEMESHLKKSELNTISSEICAFIKKHGTDLQKKGLRTYKK